jgi:sulfur carrier protein
MKIRVNGDPREVGSANLADLLEELEYGNAIVGTAVNSAFVRARDRVTVEINEGDAIEIVTPRQGG